MNVLDSKYMSTGTINSWLGGRDFKFLRNAPMRALNNSQIKFVRQWGHLLKIIA